MPISESQTVQQHFGRIHKHVFCTTHAGHESTTLLKRNTWFKCQNTVLFTVHVSKAIDRLRLELIGLRINNNQVTNCTFYYSLYRYRNTGIKTTSSVLEWTTYKRQKCTTFNTMLCRRHDDWWLWGDRGSRKAAMPGRLQEWDSRNPLMQIPNKN